MSEPPITGSTVRVPEHVVYRSFEAETLLLNLETGQYHGLNETGGRLLTLLDEVEGNAAKAIDRLAQEYEIDRERMTEDMGAFLAELAERGLVVVDGAR